MRIEALLYDGKTSKEHRVKIEFSYDRRVRIYSHNIDVALEDIEIESRLGNTPRVLEFPNGIRCKSRENDKIDDILFKFDIKKSKTHKIESSWGLSIGAVVVTTIFIWFMLTTGANFTANIIASILPKDTLRDVSISTLEKLDRAYLTPSKLSEHNKSIIQAHFNRLIEGRERDYRLHFRSSKSMGANAFALPSGDIVLTDELVSLSRDEKFRDILGVLAHEKGHVIHKHSLRMGIKTAISGVIIGYITGDISILATAIPTILINSRYSREFEREADRYAIQELQKLDVSTKYIAQLFIALEEKHKRDSNSSAISIISSHPLTKERIDYFNSFVK
jgi:Zn-dependent protease with chaperone function